MSDGDDERVGDHPTDPGDDAAGPQQPAATVDPGDVESDRSDGSGAFDRRVGQAVTAIRKERPQTDTRRADPDLLDEYTTGRRDLHPSVQFQWSPRVAVGAVVLTLILTAIVDAVGLPLALGGLAFVVLMALGVAWVMLRYRKWVYQVRADSLYLERGVLVHRRTHVPYVRIQHVDTSRGPLERWLGLSTLVVYTAGSRGADVSIPGLEPDEASDLQQRVKQLAIEAEGGDAL